MKLKGLLIALIVFFPYFSSANNPYYKLAAEVLELMISKSAGRSEAKIYLGWVAERDAAIQAILEKRLYDPKVIEAIKANLETPQKALLRIEGTEIEARLTTFYPEWKNVLYSLAQDEAIMRPMMTATAAQLMQKELGVLTHHPASHQNLLRYYREEIQKVLGDVRTHPGKIEGVSEVEETLATLEATFQTSLQAGELSRRAKEVMEETLTKLNSKLQQSIRFLEGALPQETGAGVVEVPLIAAGGREGVSLKTVRILQNSTQQYIERLRVLSQLINGYSFSLLSTGTEGIELEFLLAQVRFGTLEAQQFSFHQLVHHFAVTKQRMSTEILREVLANRNTHFRQYVIESYKKAEALPPSILASLDVELFKTRLFFPREKEFEEAVETMAALISYPDEIALGQALLLSEKTAIERVGIVRALGHMNTHYAFSTLLEILPTVGKMHDSLFRACLEELVGNVKIHSERLPRFLDVVVPLAEADELAIRKNAIWGLGEVLRLKRHPDATILTRLLAGGDPQAQRETLLALAKLPASETAAETVGSEILRPFLSNLDPELRVPAILYFSEREPQVLYELVKILELPRQTLSSETKLLVLEGIRKNFPDVALFKASLLGLAQEPSTAVRIEAFSLLARGKDPQAAEGLLALFEEGSGSQKRRIVIELLTNFEDRPTLRKTIKKIVEFYQDPRYQFDLFDSVGQEHALSQRLATLKSDSEILRYIHSLDTNSNPGLREFIAVVFQ